MALFSKAASLVGIVDKAARLSQVIGPALGQILFLERPGVAREQLDWIIMPTKPGICSILHIKETAARPLLSPFSPCCFF